MDLFITHDFPVFKLSIRQCVFIHFFFWFKSRARAHTRIQKRGLLLSIKRKEMLNQIYCCIILFQCKLRVLLASYQSESDSGESI